MLKKIGMSALGLVAVLTWWTITGRHDTADAGPSKLPAKFLNGGGGTLTIEAESTTPVRMRYMFHGPYKEGVAEDKLEGYEDREAGHYSWSTEVTPNTGVYLELGAVDPKAGAQMSWTIKLNGQELVSEKDTLEKDLEPGYAFFLQYERDNIFGSDEGD